MHVYIYLKHFWKVVVEHCALLGAGEREGLIKQPEKVLSISHAKFWCWSLDGRLKGYMKMQCDAWNDKAKPDGNQRWGWL